MFELQGYMNCTTWKLDYATSEEIKKHKNNFATSKWMTNVISEVTRKLGFFFDLEICEYEMVLEITYYIAHDYCYTA